MQNNAIKPGQKVVIVDDLLATGGEYGMYLPNLWIMSWE